MPLYPNKNQDTLFLAMIAQNGGTKQEGKGCIGIGS